MAEDPNSDAVDGERSSLVSKPGGEKRKFDPNFKGPIARRGCTDVICCVVFSAYMIGMIVIGIVAYREGDPKRLLYPTDSNGKVCGNEVQGKPYLYFFDLTKCITKGATNPFAYVKEGLTCPTPQVCVKSCPNFNQAGSLASYDKMVCTEGTVVTKDTSMAMKQNLINVGKCAPYYLESSPVFYRCMPSIAVSAIGSLGFQTSEHANLTGSDIQMGETAVKILLNLENLSMQVADELISIWHWILIGFVISMVVSLLYIVLARWITFPVIIVSMIGVLGLLGFGIYYVFFRKYKYLVDKGISQDILWRVTMGVDDFARNKNFWLVLGISLSVLFLILGLIMIFLIPRLRIASAVIAEASRAVCSMLSTLFFPILPWLLQLVWFAWFVGVLLFLMSNGVKQYRVSGNDPRYNLTLEMECNHEVFGSQYPGTNVSCLFAKYKENQHLLRMQIFHLFGWLWGMEFLVAFAECSLAGAFASYYWAFKKPKDIPTFPVFSAMGRTLSNHTGSLALGAAIIAVVQLIRITLEYIHRKLKEATNNPVADFFMKCLKCCFWCLEKCLRFLNKNAYIMIAIYGKNFCVSAKEAFSLLIRNPVRTIAVNGVTSFILFLGKLLVTGGVGVASFFWFDKSNPLMPDKLYYSAAPIAICTIGAYVVAVLFFSVYDMGIDTIFLCLLEDLERHDGSREKPYFMTESLSKIMDVENKKLKAEDIPLDRVSTR